MFGSGIRIPFEKACVVFFENKLVFVGFGSPNILVDGSPYKENSAKVFISSASTSSINLFLAFPNASPAVIPSFRFFKYSPQITSAQLPGALGVPNAILEEPKNEIHFPDKLERSMLLSISLSS